MKFLVESFKTWNIEAMTGYKPMTTYYDDFSIAEQFGINAIKDTFNKNFEQAKTNYKWLTEFVMACNWKIWEHYEHNDAFAKLYNSMWEQADQYAMDNLKDEELSYFFDTTD